MFRSAPPELSQTHPNSKIVLDVLYQKIPYKIQVINSMPHRVGFHIKPSNMTKFKVSPLCGELNPDEAVYLVVICDAVAFGQEDFNNESITIEWVHPNGATKNAVGKQ